MALLPRKPAKHPAKPKRGKKLEVEEPGVLYGRYSSHNQKDISVEQQFEKGYELAAEYGIRIIDTYADRAVSGRTDKRRDFQRMMTDAAKGKFRYVIAWKSNRMGRNMLEALINEARLQDLGVRVLYVEEDFDDTAAGRFAARSMMNVNQFYSENMAEDIKRGLYDNAANCMVANGHLPYGYKADETLHYAIDEPKAAVIREIFTRVSCGEAFVDIMASLNARGIKTSYGRPWGRSSFQRILSNERYRGIYIYGDVRKEGGIPRIVSDELYFKVQEVITTKKNPQGRHRVNGDYLLTGKLFCGKCKSPMVGISGTGRSGKLHYYYVCQKHRTEKTCDKKNVRRDEIELQVAQAIKDYALKDDVIEWIADSTVAYNERKEAESKVGILEDQLAGTERGIKNIMSAIEQGIITETTKSRLVELESERATIKAKIAAARADIVTVSRDDIISGLEMFRDGDVYDKKYQARLFDTFLVAVYVYDDDLRLVFSFSGNKNTIQIPIESAVNAVENNAAECSFKLCSAPPKIPIVLLDGRYFSFPGRWSRSLSPSGEIHLPPPKIPIVLLDGRYFSFPGRCTNARQMHGAEKNLDCLRQHREEKPHMIRPPTPWAGFCCSAPLTLPVRSGARPAPAATGRPRACQSNRRTPSARRARTATGTHLPTPAAAQNTPRIAASAFLPSGCKIIMHLDNFRS